MILKKNKKMNINKPKLNFIKKSTKHY